MKVAIIQYSTYGHITKFAQSVKEGVEKSGLASKVDIFQVPETLSEDVLNLIHAPPKDTETIPLATNDTLIEYDAFLFGVPTRFGTLPSQWSSFWDSTGSLWAKGSLYGKPVGIFVSTGSPHGGQETTIRSFLSYVVHHGLIYIPLGYGPAFTQLSNLDEIHGGSAYGSGMYAGTDGSRSASTLELELATIHGESFAKAASKFVSSKVASKDAVNSGTAEPQVTEAEKDNAENSKQTVNAEKVVDEDKKNNTNVAADSAKSTDKSAVRASQSKPSAQERQSKCKCTIM